MTIVMNSVEEWHHRLLGFSLFKPSLPVIYSSCSDIHRDCLELTVIAKKAADENEYYDDVEIAALLGISLGRLRNKISAGDPLPPRVRPAGCHKRLWPRQAVHEWLRRFGDEVGRRDGFLSRP